ncbi:MAG TPA: T9SS type A sorting domain-containing protein [Ignavibacteria bacterium]|jgi:hypothetical protein
MQKKKLFIASALVLLIAVGGFMIRGWNDNASIVEYINNGGPIEQPTTPVYTPPQFDAPTWSLGAPFPAPTRYHGEAATYKLGEVTWLYCSSGDVDGTGNNTNLLNIYNVSTNTWTLGAPSTTPDNFYGMLVRLGDTLYLMGGIGDGGAFTSMLNNVGRYHVPSNTWTAGRNLPNTSADAECEGYQDSLIYVIGGLSNGTSAATANVWLYNRVSGYRAATPLPAARSGHGAAILGDTIFVICGGTTYSGGLSNIVYRGVISQSDRSTITWTTGTNYPGTARHRFDADVWGCTSVIIGPGSPAGFTSGTECYVYRGNTWTAQPPIPAPRMQAFYGSASTSAGVWKWVVASGLNQLQPPYSVPDVNILTDTLCPVATCGQRHTLTRNNGFTKPIPDVSTMRDTINVTSIGQACTICDVNVRIDTALHTWDSDLAFTLTHSATTVALITNRGGSGDNFIGTILDDSAATPISAGTAPFTGSFRPESPLTAFTGNPNGLWVLTITDGVGGDSGYLKQWAMVISYTCPVGGIQTIEVPFTYRLSQNYPNPFNPQTTIKYGLPKPGMTRLVVYDILGRVVTTLVNEYKTAGLYDVNFDGSNLASGIYFYNLESGDYKETKKMLLIK